MRNAFIRGLTAAAKHNPRIMLITGDLGYRFLDVFAQQFPEQFLNIGVAEANLVTVAAGLSTVGFIPFIYSIATFASMRAFEQIRTDIILQNLNVKIVGIGAGLAYTKAGPTHHSYEDIALMRMLPGMVIVNPGNPSETESATITLTKYQGPAYLRLERNPERNGPATLPDFTIGKGGIVEKGNRVAILYTGTKTGLAWDVANAIKLKPTIAAFPTIKPLDGKLLSTIVKHHKYIVTLEEHASAGGFGSGVLEWANIAGVMGKIRILNIGLTGGFNKVTGEYAYLSAQNGFTPEKISQQILHWINHG